MKLWTVRLTRRVEMQLAEIKDRRIQAGLRSSLKRLEYEPERQGKLLGDELADYYSVRAVGQRYRIIYKLETEQVIVLVVTVGIRRAGERTDVYELAKKLIRLGLLDVE